MLKSQKQGRVLTRKELNNIVSGRNEVEDETRIFKGSGYYTRYSGG